MILTVDIGNTIIAVGGFEDERLEFVVRLATNIKETSHEYAAKLDSILRLSDTETDCVSAAVVSSVILVAADTVARNAFSPIEIPVGVVVAVIGVPYFIYLMIKEK